MNLLKTIKSKFFMASVASLTLLVESPIFGDALIVKVQSFITNTVLPWTRIVGILVVIGGIVGLMLSKHKEEKLSGIWYVIFSGIAIFGIPEIINLLLSSFGATSVDFGNIK